MKKIENLLKQEKKFKKILENSIPGTLAHSESKFYLSVIKSIKKLKGIKLKDSDLEAIAGGISFKSRALASMAAFLSLISANPTALAEESTAVQQTNNVRSYKKSQMDEYTEILARVRNMSDEETEKNLRLISEQIDRQYVKVYSPRSFKYELLQPVLTLFKARFDELSDLSDQKKMLAGYMYFNAFMETHPKYITDDSLYQLKAFGNVSESNIQSLIDTEKERFKKLGTIDNVEYFKIEKDIEKSIDTHVFLLALNQINKLLEKYRKLTNQLIDILKNSNKSLNISSGDLGGELMASGSPLEGSRDFCIFLSTAALGNFGAPSCLKMIGTLSGDYSHVEANQLVSSIAAHEIGHIFENVIYLLHLKTSPAATSTNFLAKVIKEKIIKIAKEKYGATDSKISKYGETNDQEWFAEVFANLECANEENISPYGEAMRDVIKMFEDNTITKEELQNDVLHAIRISF
ncbi:MAG: hypothetical protein IKE05_05020 [Clostridia bacterium]|nr:hypothetical protein [Clostridia bacterium]